MKKNTDLLELDVWRGIAVLFMIANHAGFAFLASWSELNGLERSFIFIGSFAPVLFFFITGFGYGLSHSRRSNEPAQRASDWFDGGTWFKAAILLMMDMLLRGAHLHAIGWDFLGFIAFSMILLSFLRRLRAPVTVAVVAITLLLGVRYGLGPVLERLGPSAAEAPVLWHLVGLRAFEGVSYWFTPWLIYPLLGFVAGVYYPRVRERWVNQWRLGTVLLALASVPFFVVAGLAFIRGMVFFRWGTMSIAYFILSFAVLLACAVLAWLLAVRPSTNRIARAVAQRGVASLAIVPIHYAFIYYLEQVFGGAVSTSVFLVLFLVVVAGSYLLGRSIQELSRNLVNLNRSPLLVMGLVGAVVFLIITIDLLPLQEQIRMSYIFGLELILCLLLPLRVRFPSRASASAEYKPKAAD